MMRVLEYYSIPIDGNFDIDHLHYIKRDLPENLPDKNVDLLTWYAAYHVCLALQDKAGIEAAMAKIQEIQTAESI